MDYQLQHKEDKSNLLKTAKSFNKFLGGELKIIFAALFFVLVNSLSSILGPRIQGDALDDLLIKQDLNSLLGFVSLLALIYLIGAIASYLQIMLTGRVGQRVLFKLRDSLFKKLQSLPLSFFNVNKTGDLISRINSDTDKVNSFLSENLLRLIGSVFVLIGIAIFMFLINTKLAVVTLSVTVILFAITQIISPLLKRLNRVSLDSTGGLSAQIQEGLNAFKVIVAFNRRDYFENKFNEFNKKNYNAALRADIFNQLLKPIYDLASNAAQLVVVLYGLSLVKDGEITFGVLFTFFTYTQRFYEPLRILANIWSSVQLSLAAWSRIQDILKLESNLQIIDKPKNTSESKYILEFKDVDFGYTDSKLILKDISLALEKGKTYALVGPTGGGKSTTAALMARLYDPVSGVVNLHGQDVRSFSFSELSSNVGFILQEPLLFTGSVADNIKYGNNDLANLDNESLHKVLEEKGLAELIDKFQSGLNTEISNNAENISLGQKQIISFVRTILRNPALLILDEATANIDTVTEQLLQSILEKLPKETTKVVIAHRLNTIKKADQIFFVNNGSIQMAKDFNSIEDLILNQKRVS